ncbi:site-specific integrase, partial [Mesorhizobium sp. M2A.F.Ca.ET.039.01.1.1]|uniref:site-specific integrase n=1 Tax=Mesorhizobium sp. M2A.F.Ca.ET.039.01.1.1 TaxID=2496746 RepID=UPI000FF7607D
MTAADNSKGAGQDDDLPDVIEIVRAMGLDAMGEDTEPPSPALPAAAPHPDHGPRLPAHLEKLADRARGYVEAASSANTRRAYAADWKRFCAWARRQGVDAFSPDPRVVGLYITACASGSVSGDKQPNSVSTIERRLSSLSWNFTQRGQP